MCMCMHTHAFTQMQCVVLSSPSSLPVLPFPVKISPLFPHYPLYSPCVLPAPPPLLPSFLSTLLPSGILQTMYSTLENQNYNPRVRKNMCYLFSGLGLPQYNVLSNKISNIWKLEIITPFYVVAYKFASLKSMYDFKKKLSPRISGPLEKSCIAGS